MSIIRNRFYNVKIHILIVLTILLTFAVSLFILNRQFNHFKEESIYYYNTIIEESIDKKIELSANSEALFDKQAYHLMTSLSNEFKNISKEDVDSELLEMISEKYDVTGLCILEDEGSSARIKTSTVPGERGMSTEGWGFWNTAIVELFNGDSVSIEKGFTVDNFWIGPKTYSYVEKAEEGSSQFYKYAYIKKPEQDYMVSAIISERNYIMDEYNLSDLLKDYEQKIDFIDSVFIVDLDRLKNSNVDKEPFIVFGQDRLGLFPLISQEIKRSSEDLTGSHYVKSGDTVHDFVLNKISDDRYIVTILSGSNSFNGIFSAVAVLIVIFAVAIYSISVLIRKHSEQFQNLISLEYKRGEVALELSKTLSAIPDFVFKCTLSEDKSDIMLSFNEGSALEPGNYIPIGSPPVPMSDYYPEEFMDSVKSQIMLGFSGLRSQFEFKFSDRIYSFSTNPLYSEPEDVSEVMVTGIDVSSYIEDREKSKFMAYHDSLTLLPNRNMLKHDMSDITAGKSSSTVYYLDLDGFKAVNDILGHQRGDSLLKDVADIITSSLKPEMKVYRIGGDEFIILDSTVRDSDSLDAFSEELKKNISSLESQFEEDITLGVSIGIAIYPDHGETRESLLSKADQAMYQSKINKDTLYTISV